MGSSIRYWGVLVVYAYLAFAIAAARCGVEKARLRLVVGGVDSRARRTGAQSCSEGLRACGRDVESRAASGRRISVGKEVAHDALIVAAVQSIRAAHIEGKIDGKIKDE